MRRHPLVGIVVVVALLGALCVAAVPAADASRPPARPFSVMTRNVYLGADVGPILAARTPAETLAAVATAWDDVVASDFPGRATKIADDARRTRPTFIGLQEVVEYRIQDPGDGPATPATEVALDFLDVQLDALAAAGLDYAPVSVGTGYDVELPGLFPTGLRDVRITQREVILARTDLPPSRLAIEAGFDGRYQARLTLPTAFPGVSIELPWAWAGVDALVDGRPVRVLSTHLDAVSPLVRDAQAAELRDGPAATDRPLVVLGDLNATPDEVGSGYAQLLAAGLTDAWLASGARADGSTCCQAADLANRRSTLDRRIDYVLVRGLDVEQVRLVGDRPHATRSGPRWASDHAGLVVTLRLPKPRPGPGHQRG